MRRSRFGEGDMLTLSLPTVVAPNLRLWETAGWNTSCEATEAIAKLGISQKRRYFEDKYTNEIISGNECRHPLTRDFEVHNILLLYLTG